MQSFTTISQKGQVVIPKHIRDHLNISPNDKFTVNLKGRSIIVEPVPTTKEMMGAFTPTRHMTKKEMKETIKKAVQEKYRNK